MTTTLPESDYDSILPIVRKYKEINKEVEDISKDIRDYKQRFRARLDVLKTEKSALEKLIIEFLDKHHHPGIRDQDTTVMKLEKKARLSIKTKQAEIESILNKYSVDRDAHQEVVNILLGKVDQPKTLYLKITKQS